MPFIAIQIDEQQEAKITEAIQNRQNFYIEGGRVSDGEKMIFLQAITFEFMPGDGGNAYRLPQMMIKRLPRTGDLEAANPEWPRKERG